MRSVWKGFVVGAFTGAAVGLALEQAERSRPGDAGAARPSASDRIRRGLAGGQVWKGLAVGALTGAAVGAGLDLAEQVRAGVITATTATGQAVRERGPRLARRFADSDTTRTVAGATRTAAHQVAGAARQAGQVGAGVTADLAGSVRDAAA